MENFVADAIFIDAPAETVFAAILCPEDILEWMDAESAEVAGEPGGIFRAQRTDGSTVVGEIRVLAPGARIEIVDYYWEFGNSRRGPMALNFDLRRHDDGVWLTVRQRDMDGQSEWQQFAEQTGAGWVRATVALKRHIEQI